MCKMEQPREIKNVGRPREDDPKYIQSIRLKVSTLVKIDEIADYTGKSKSYIIQEIIDKAVDAHCNLLGIETNY